MVRDYGLLLCGVIAALAFVYLAGTSGPGPSVWRNYAIAQEQVVQFREAQIQELRAQCQVGVDDAKFADATRLLNNLVRVVEGESEQSMDEALEQAKGRLMEWGVIPMTAQ